MQREDVDAVDILVPHDLHREVAVSAAEAGKHVLCEKPIATALEDADKMINAAKQYNIKLMMGHNYRFMLHYMRTKELIDEGTIGTVYLATAEGLSGVTAGPLPTIAADSWRYSLSQAGGEIFISHGIHYCDLLKWLIGEVKGVYGITESFVYKTREVEDNAFAFLTFQSGSLGYIHATQTERGPYWNERVKICGTEGTVVTDWATGKLEIYSHEVPEHLRGWASFSMGNQWKLSIEREIEHFVDCIREDKKPLITGKDGKAALQIVLAAYQSAKTRNLVKIS